MANQINRNYCIILAGGRGRRLWPCSRMKKPKQFLDFFGFGRTQLQQTFDRIARIIPKENIYVNTNEKYAHLVREQLPEVPPEHVLAEPVHRNTAPSVAWACHRILHDCPDANVLVTPSDQAVNNEQAYSESIMEGLSFVQSHEGLLTIGVKPTRPEPGYGYIQIGDRAAHDIYKVKSFTEKPEREFAKMFLESEEFYWNTGLFLARVKYLRSCFSKFLPAILHSFDSENADWTIEQESDFIRENFPSYPNVSIDYGILEKCERVYVLKGDFGWADLGTWHSIFEAKRKSPDDNVIVDSDVVIDNARNNVIKLPKGRLAVINGLDGYIVAEHDNVLLICKKQDSSSLIRKYVNEVQIQRGDEFV